MRIITEDNIDQLLNLSYQSKNINKLLHIDHGENGKVERDVKEIIENYTKTLENQSKIRDINTVNIKKYEKAEPIEPRTIEYTPEQPSPEYMPDSSPLNSPPENNSPDSINSLEFDSSNSLESNVVFSPHTPEDSPPSQLGGAAHIFNDPYMNETFNNLSGGQKAQILQIPFAQRGNVMNEIMRKVGIMGNPLNNPLQNPLNNAFDALPQNKQIVALQGGYSSMAKEFNSLAKQIPDSLVTINKPIPMALKLAQQLPLFAVEQKGGSTNDSDNGNNDNGNNNGNNNGNDNGNDNGNNNVKDSDTSTSDNNKGGGTKIIKFT